MGGSETSRGFIIYDNEKEFGPHVIKIKLFFVLSVFNYFKTNA
jgi:hypothetical protein